MKKALLLGCGASKQKRLWTGGEQNWDHLVTLDRYPECKPDILWDLDRIPWEPLESNQFDEVHAYEVLEHCSGYQGDEVPFFACFSEIWRVLKPSGILLASVPEGDKWTWGDPSHKRVINKGTLTFLMRAEYERQVGVTNMSDYRHIYKANFNLVWEEHIPDHFMFILQAVK